MPSAFRFTLDVRDREAQVRRTILDEVHALVERVCAEDGLGFEETVHNDIAPTPLDADLIELFDRAAEAAGVRRQRMHSGAGHDAMIFAPHVPTAMVFVPSKGGKSHTPKEFTALDDIMPGIEVLYRGLERLAYD